MGQISFWSMLMVLIYWPKIYYKEELCYALEGR
jgi:hypothetical protein